MTGVTKLVGTLALAMATLIGPRLAGDAFDLFHSYNLPIALSAVASLLAAAIVMILPEPQAGKSALVSEAK